MIAFEIIGARIDTASPEAGAEPMARSLILASEQVLENWIEAHDQMPTEEAREGFRLLALHRQGAKGDPSFNACRETCRELAYRYNLIIADDPDTDVQKTLEMMRLLSRHLYYFISGKLQDAKLGEFCCSSKPMRVN